MLYKTKILSVVTVITLLSSIFLTAMPAYAASDTNSSGNFLSGLVQYISQKLGLDQAKVQAAVNEYKSQKMANITPRPTMSAQQIQDAQKTRLDKLVSQGKITNSQETAILNELQTLESKYPLANLKNMTPQQRKQQFLNEMNDIITWAKSQGIDAKYVKPGFGMRMGGRGFGHRYMGWKTNITPTPTSS